MEYKTPAQTLFSFNLIFFISDMKRKTYIFI